MLWQASGIGEELAEWDMKGGRKKQALSFVDKEAHISDNPLGLPSSTRG